jgi:hypothetical protein
LSRRFGFLLSGLVVLIALLTPSRPAHARGDPKLL